jgi:hypothetical protein
MSPYPTKKDTYTAHNHSSTSLNGGDEKVIQAHVEDVNELERRSVDDYKSAGNGASGGHVADSDARNYLNPDIVITDEMNKKLRRRIHKRYISSFFISTLARGTPDVEHWRGEC